MQTTFWARCQNASFFCSCSSTRGGVISATRAEIARDGSINEVRMYSRRLEWQDELKNSGNHLCFSSIKITSFSLHINKFFCSKFFIYSVLNDSYVYSITLYIMFVDLVLVTIAPKRPLSHTSHLASCIRFECLPANRCHPPRIQIHCTYLSSTHKCPSLGASYIYIYVRIHMTL